MSHTHFIFYFSLFVKKDNAKKKGQEDKTVKINNSLEDN